MKHLTPTETARESVELTEDARRVPLYASIETRENIRKLAKLLQVTMNDAIGFAVEYTLTEALQDSNGIVEPAREPVVIQPKHPIEYTPTETARASTGLTEPARELDQCEPEEPHQRPAVNLTEIETVLRRNSMRGLAPRNPDSVLE
jgi:hypothetical protein